MIKTTNKKELGDTIPIENYNGVLEYKTDDIERSFLLTSERKKDLKQIFGKHNRVHNTGEHYFHIWIVEFKNEIFHVLSAKGKGTCIEIEADFNQNKSEVCIEFLKEIEKEIRNLYQ